MTVPLISPDPTKDKNINYLKYPIYLGGNRGRGQLYPDGSCDSFISENKNNL
jgi:apocytochrome f